MTVTVYPFHDGHLTSISVADRTAVLGLEQVGGERFRMTLTAVEAFCVDGFREGNTILDLRSVSGGRPTGEDLAGLEAPEVMEILFPGPHPSAAEQYREVHAAFIQMRMDALASREAVMVVLAPAYGADLYAYCRSVDLQPA